MLVSVTYSRVRSLLALPRFASLAVASMTSAQQADGNRGARPFLMGPLRWCTITAWDSEAHMLAWVRGPAHREAMKASRALVADTAFLRLENTDYDDVSTARAKAMVREALAARVARAGA